MEIAEELRIELEENDIQRAHRLGKKQKSATKARPIIARFVSYEKEINFSSINLHLKDSKSFKDAFVVLDLTQACATQNRTRAIFTKNYLSRAACYRCCNVNATVAASTSCDCRKRKKQNETNINSLPSYYNTPLLFLILIGRKTYHYFVPFIFYLG